ncbi:hypothetical protein AAG906_003921 [Vitis piasezkii]
MSLHRLLLRSLRRSSSLTSAATSTNQTLIHQQPQPTLVPIRTFAFSSAEEAAAERRRRKRRLRIEPPLHALRRDPSAPRPRPDPNARGCRTPPLPLSGHASTSTTSNIVPNIVSYNVLINTHCDAGRVDVGLDIYRHILANAPFSPSPVTYRHLTKGLIDSGRIGEAVDLLREMLNKGHGADSLVYNNLISGFLNLENEAKAIELFDELKERCLVYDGVVNGTFMDWYFTKGREKCAMDSYKSLLDRQFRMTPVTCNALLEVLLKHDKKAEAWALFDQIVMVNECVKLGKFTEAIEVFKKVGKKQGSKPFAMDVAGYNNIIARFCENGLLSEAEQLFGELSTKSLTPDVNIYRTFIEAYFGVERADDALKMFNRFVDSGLRVIVSFANKVFDELVNKGKAGECVPVLTKMGEKDPKPDPTTYEIVIKGLCKERLFDASRDLMGQMVRYNIGVTPSLREFVVEAFGKEGRSEEIERLLEANRPGFGAYWPPSGPPRMAGPLEWQDPSNGRASSNGWTPQMAEPLEWQDLLEWQNPRMAESSRMEEPPQMAGQASA